jgi:hypothetical protein
MGDEESKDERKFEVTVEELSKILPGTVVEGERGGVAWVDLFGYTTDADGVHPFKIGLTARALTAKEALISLVEAVTDGKMNLEKFKETTHLSLIQRMPGKAAPAAAAHGASTGVANIANAPAPAVKPGVPAPAPTAIGAPAPVPGGAVAAAQDVGGQVTGGWFPIVSLDITPKADGKVKLDFFGNDKKTPRNQYASITWVTTPENAIQKLFPVAAFTLAQLSAAGQFSLACRLYWVNAANLNKNGVPYKNVDHFELA